MLLRELTQNKTDRNIAHVCYFWKKYEGKVPFSFLPFDNCISGILYLKYEEKMHVSKILLRKRYLTLFDTMVKIPCSVISEN